MQILIIVGCIGTTLIFNFKHDVNWCWIDWSYHSHFSQISSLRPAQRWETRLHEVHWPKPETEMAPPISILRLVSVVEVARWKLRVSRTV